MLSRKGRHQCYGSERNAEFSATGPLAARACSKDGYAVTLAGRRADALGETASRAPGGHGERTGRADRRDDPESVARAVLPGRSTRSVGVDVLFNNAGINVPGDRRSTS